MFFRFEAGHDSGSMVSYPVNIFLFVMMAVGAVFIVYVKTMYKELFVEGTTRLMVYLSLLIPFVVYTRVWPFYMLEDTVIFRHVATMAKYRSKQQIKFSLSGVMWFFWVVILCSVPYLIFFQAQQLVCKGVLFTFIFITAFIGSEEDAPIWQQVLSSIATALLWTGIVHVIRDMREPDSDTSVVLVWLKAVHGTWKSATRGKLKHKGLVFRFIRALFLTLMRALWPLLTLLTIYVLTPLGAVFYKYKLVQGVCTALYPVAGQIYYWLSDYIEAFLQIMNDNAHLADEAVDAIMQNVTHIMPAAKKVVGAVHSEL